MKPTDISRRQFTQIAATAAGAGLPLRGAATPTAQTVVERLKAALGGDWPATGVDGFKAGDPNTAGKGLATTAMATMDVLKQAVKGGANLIFSYEPTFYGRQDGPASASGGGRGFGGVSAEDPVYKGKKEFIEKNGLVVFRLHDHWVSRKEGEMTTALGEALGWAKNRVKPDDALYEIPSATAEAVVARVREKLKLRGGLRAVGDRKATVRRVMLCPGVMPLPTIWQRYAEADLMITGEVREWENTYFAEDLFTADEKHGLVTLGRVVSEDPGMRACAAWLKGVVKEVPAQWISAGDLYWRAV